MAQDEEGAERVVRQQTDIPWVMNEPSRSSDREIPICRYAEEASRVDEYRVHMAENVHREIGSGSDLIGPLEVMRCGAPTPCQKKAGADLEKHGCDQQWFAYGRAINDASDLHHGRMRIWPYQSKQMIDEMKRHI